MDYAEKKINIGNAEITFRYRGWDHCINFLPVLVLRANPVTKSWYDFSFEFHFAIWACGFRVRIF